jgi:hypothetical protein
MRIGIVLAYVVSISGYRFMGCNLFEPHLVIMVKARLIVIYKHGRGNVHGIAEYQPFFDAAFPQTVFDPGGDIDKSPSGGHIKPEFFSIGFHFLPFQL